MQPQKKKYFSTWGRKDYAQAVIVNLEGHRSWPGCIAIARGCTVLRPCSKVWKKRTLFTEYNYGKLRKLLENSTNRQNKLPKPKHGNPRCGLFHTSFPRHHKPSTWLHAQSGNHNLALLIPQSPSEPRSLAFQLSGVKGPQSRTRAFSLQRYTIYEAPVHKPGSFSRRMRRYSMWACMWYTRGSRLWSVTLANRDSAAAYSLLLISSLTMRFKGLFRRSLFYRG